jgi:hypothetical protein
MATPYAQPPCVASPPDRQPSLGTRSPHRYLHLRGLLYHLGSLVIRATRQPQTKAMPYFIAYVIGSFLNVGIHEPTALHHERRPCLNIACLRLISIATFVMSSSIACDAHLTRTHFNGPELSACFLTLCFFFGGLYFVHSAASTK